MQHRRHRWLGWLLLVPLAGLGWWAYASWRHGSAVPGATRPAPESEAVAALQAAAANANLVICVLDAARADHFGCYGYPRDTTPNTDALARDALRFDRHFTQYVTTKPSTASLFTSQYSDTHLVSGNRGLLPGTFTIAAGLEAAGFHTALFSSNPNASPGAGIGLDFQDRFDQTDVKPLVKRWEDWTRPEPMLELFRRWLEQNRRRRFFAYLHLDPPHQPYLQPAWMTHLFEGKRLPGFQQGEYEFPVGEKKTVAPYSYKPLLEWINLYDANLRYADWAVGELASLLRKAGVYDNTLFVVSADHGEAFGEHGYLWHERGVYDELTRIPLILKWPGQPTQSRTIGALTETVDLLPTVFDAFRIAYPRPEVQGRSLLPLIAGDIDKVHDYVFCRSDGDPPSYLVRSLNHALILYGNGQWRVLYDLKADPVERRNVIAEQPEQADKMLAAFEAFAHAQRRPPLDFLKPHAALRPAPRAPEHELTAEMRRRLRGLGYL